MDVKSEQSRLGHKICGCGRSPTGYCIGWHALTEELYQEQLSLYQSQQEDKDTEDK